MQQYHFLFSFCLWLMIRAQTHSVSGHNVSTIAPADIPASQKGLTITSSDTKIIPNMTDYLKVSCKYVKPENAQIMSVMSLVLSYWNKVKRIFENLILVTHFSPHNVTVIRDVGATVSGDLHQNGESFLTMEWNYPDQDVATSYQCFVNTMAKMGSTFGTKVGLQVNLESNDVSSLAKEMLELKKKLKDQETEQMEQNKKIDKLKTDLLKQEQKGMAQDSTIDKVLKQLKSLQRFNEFGFRTSSFGFNNNNRKDILFWSTKTFRFQQAQDVCREFGGKLVEYPFKLLKNADSKLKDDGVGTGYYYWTGITRATPTSDWVYLSSGKPAGNIPWMRTPTSNRNCAKFHVGKTGYLAGTCGGVQTALCSRAF